MLEREYDFYIKNLSALLKKYKGKYIVIVGEEVVGSYDTEIDAYTNSIKLYELGSFLIQYCIPEKKVQPQMFHSRAVFS
ncbi:MAG: hypothetical protein KAW88_07690 [Candidatus Cloacimonetes bacterium]|nr:hypothetical protein [Candidatus Cloacimonadota bacterium]